MWKIDSTILTLKILHCLLSCVEILEDKILKWLLTLAREYRVFTSLNWLGWSLDSSRERSFKLYRAVCLFIMDSSLSAVPFDIVTNSVTRLSSASTCWNGKKWTWAGLSLVHVQETSTYTGRIQNFFPKLFILFQFN